MSLNIYTTNLLSPPVSMSKDEQEGLSEKPAHQSCLCFLPANLQMFEARFQNQRKFHRMNLNLAIYHVTNTSDVSAGGKDSQDGMVFNLIIYHVIL